MDIVSSIVFISCPLLIFVNVVIAMKGLQDRNIHILDGMTVENKVKLIIIVSINKTVVISTVFTTPAS